ncbi:MAG: hypothetical protein U9P70_02210 [Patescibacteria group bacterium]|nr:hypothetical protein [Patescibacteria group bacterium]
MSRNCVVKFRNEVDRFCWCDILIKKEGFNEMQEMDGTVPLCEKCLERLGELVEKHPPFPDVEERQRQRQRKEVASVPEIKF